MNSNRDFDLGWAAFIPRTILGFIVVFSGAARFQLGYDAYAHAVGAIPYAGFVPPAALMPLLTLEALVEIVLGVMLLLGVRTRAATWLVALLMLIINAGYGLAGLLANSSSLAANPNTMGEFGPTAQSGMFLGAYPFVRAWLILFLLLLPVGADRYSLDRLLSSKSSDPDAGLSQARAIFVARVLVASGWFIASINKVFIWGAMAHAQKLFIGPYSDTWIGHPPFGAQWLLWALGLAIPYLELVASFLLLVGIWTRPAIVVLGLILSLVSFGHLVPAPIGRIMGLFTGLILPRAALLVVVLMLPREADRYSLARLFSRRSDRGRKMFQPAVQSPGASS